MKQDKNISPIHTLLFAPLLLVAALILLPSSVVYAEAVKAQQWDITADKMTRYENPPSIIAEGNVVLRKTEKFEKKMKKGGTDWGVLLEEKDTGTQEKEQTVTRTKVLTTIKADWIAYDINQGTIRARGALLIDIGPDKLTAESGRINLNSETGSFTNATIIRQDKDLHLEGRLIEKTGDLTYHIEDGWVITCKLKGDAAPPWSFAAADADITDNGYAVLKHTTFRIKNVPVFYSPWMVLPVKRTRQTGFLFPNISSSDRDGWGLNMPFFLNLSPSSDLTVYPEYLGKRGLMTGLEFRYVKNQQSKSNLMGNYLSDELSDPSEIDYYRDGNYTHTNKDRYWLRGKADHNFAGWITRLDLDIVSDRDYLTEFTSGLTGFNNSNQNFLEVFGRSLENKTIDERKNTLRVLKSWQNMSLEGELLGINDVRLNDSAPTPLWKMPALNYTGLIPLGDTRFNFDWDATYVDYWREDGVGAHRIDVFPRLFMPLPLGDYLEATANLGVRDTLYFIQEYGDADWTGSDSENRFLVDFSTEIGTTLIRDFNASLGDVNAWRHTFRPYVKYRYIPDVDQTDLPYFDNVDRIDDVNMFAYGLDNFFKISGTSNGRKFDRQYGYIKLLQGYDLRSAESDTPLTPIYVKVGYWPWQNTWLLYKTDVDVYGDGVLNYSMESGYRNSRGDILAADYRYNREAHINSITATAKINLFYNLIAAYHIERSNAASLTVEENIALIYQASCWSVELSSHYTPGNQAYMLTFRLANIGETLGVDLPGF